MANGTPKSPAKISRYLGPTTQKNFGQGVKQVAQTRNAARKATKNQPRAQTQAAVAKARNPAAQKTAQAKSRVTQTNKKSMQ